MIPNILGPLTSIIRSIDWTGVLTALASLICLAIGGVIAAGIIYWAMSVVR